MDGQTQISAIIQCRQTIKGAVHTWLNNNGNNKGTHQNKDSKDVMSEQVLTWAKKVEAKKPSQQL